MSKKIYFMVLCLLTSAGLAFAQNQTVSGRVTEAEEGSPIPGVTVSVQGTRNGTVTNADGRYSLSVPDGASLVFNCLGYEEQVLPVGGRGVINVALRAEAVNLDEVVVTAVGIQRSSRSLGYSLTKVDAEETIQKAEPDMLRALDGKVAGVQISSPSGDAGGATRVTVRGNSSFLGNNQPLYVVDGVPYSNSGTSSSGRGGEIGAAYGSGISTLDPNDIQTISVLKGAAAAVLYGSRGANGVVLITTKSGNKAKDGKKGYVVSLNTSYAIEKIASLPDYQNSYGQGSNFQFAGSNGSWGPAFTPGATMNMYSAFSDYPNLALELYPDLGGKIPYQAYPNNVKNLFDTGSVWDNSVNVQSTTEKGTFSATGSYTTQNGYIPSSTFDRYSISLGGDQQLTERFHAGGNLSFSITDQSSPLYGNNQSSAELGGQNSLARAFIMPRSWDIQSFPYQKLDGSNLLFQLSSQANNPYWAWEHDKVTTRQKRTVSNLNAGYQFTDWLSAEYTFGYNSYQRDRSTVIDKGSRGYGGKGYINRGEFSHESLESTFLLTADEDFGDLNLRATLGHNYTQETQRGFSATGLIITNKGVQELQVGNTGSQTASESKSRWRKWGLFLDVLLNYKDWAFLNLSGRNDFSSTLPAENRSYFYPAVSASVVFTDALGISDSSLNFGKLRASWAKVGNDAGPYYVNGFYVTGNPYMGQPLMEFPTVQYDENLKPEFTREFETGVELKFFESRIGFDGTYYNRVSDDQIGTKSMPPSSGYSSIVTNFGSIRNQGFELGLDLYPVMTKDFKWSIYTTFTKNISEVLSLADGVEKINIGGDFSTPRPVLIVGQPYGVLEGDKIARDDEGNPLVNPTNGMYINDTEVGIIGDPNPDYKTSMINTLSWKGLTFSFMFDYQHGGCVYSSYLTDLLGRGVTKDTEDRLGSRIIPGVYGDPKTLKPYLDASGNKIRNTTTLAESDLWFSDGTYSTFAINSVDEVATYDATVLRLREMSLSYRLPQKWVTKAKVSGVEVGVVGRNLWFWAPNVPKYSNYDPVSNAYGETNVQGIDYTAAPSTKRFAFNLKLTF